MWQSPGEQWARNVGGTLRSGAWGATEEDGDGGGCGGVRVRKA